MNMPSRDGSLRTMDRVIGAAKRNPEGVLLLAAGCALLMRGIGAATHALRDSENGAYESRSSRQQKGSTNGRRRAAVDYEEEAHGFVDTAREYASDLAGRVAHSAEAAVHYADDARRAAFEQTGRVARQTRSGASDAMDRMMNEQPLTLALFGLAAGALLAGALPGTRLERRALAPAGDVLADAAQEARRRVQRSTSKAKQRASEVAEERGLTSEGLKRAARDVADTFSGELMREGETETRRGKTKSAARPKAKSQRSAGSQRSESASGGGTSAVEAQPNAAANGADTQQSPETGSTETERSS